MEWARRAEDVRLQAALQLRLADTLDRLGDPVGRQLHRGGRAMLEDGASGADRMSRGNMTLDACEIRSASAED